MSETTVGMWMTTGEVAQRWQISSREVQRMAAQGRLAAFRVGRQLRFSPKAIADFERANTTRARSGMRAR